MLTIKIDIALSGAKVELTATQQKAVERCVKQLLLEDKPADIKPKRKYHKKRKFPFGAKPWTPEAVDELKSAYHAAKSRYDRTSHQMAYVAAQTTRTPGACYMKLLSLGELKKVKVN